MLLEIALHQGSVLGIALLSLSLLCWRNDITNHLLIRSPIPCSTSVIKETSTAGYDLEVWVPWAPSKRRKSDSYREDSLESGGNRRIYIRNWTALSWFQLPSLETTLMLTVRLDLQQMTAQLRRSSPYGYVTVLMSVWWEWGCRAGFGESWSVSVTSTRGERSRLCTAQLLLHYACNHGFLHASFQGMIKLHYQFTVLVYEAVIQSKAICTSLEGVYVGTRSASRNSIQDQNLSFFLPFLATWCIFMGLWGWSPVISCCPFSQKLDHCSLLSIFAFLTLMSVHYKQRCAA